MNKASAFTFALIFSLTAGDGQSREQRREFELVGEIVPPERNAFRAVTPVVFLHGAVTPFSSKTQAGPDGKFKFKKLAAGTYTLVVIVPRAGEMRKTVVVGPSFADAKGRVAASIAFERKPGSDRRRLVSAAELSVPEAAMTEYQRAQECLQKRDVECASAHLKAAVEIAPQFAVAWNNLGTIAYQTRQYELAEERFRESLKQDPDLYSPLVNLGGTLLSQRRYQEALSVNVQAVKAMPDDPLAHSQLGQSYYWMDQLEEAERHLRQAKALDPSHFTYPQLVLIQIYRRKGDLASAARELEEFIKLHPDTDLAREIRKKMEAKPEPPD